MPSRRSSILIGLFMICSLSLIVDVFVFGGELLNSIMSGLNPLLNILIIPLLAISLVSLFLDRRDGGDSGQPSQIREDQRTQGGIRSISGQPVPRRRAQTRVRHGRRAKRLETIVVEESEGPSTPTRQVQPQPTRQVQPQPTRQVQPQPTRQVQPRTHPSSIPPVPTTAKEEPVLDVEQQLAAIEQGIAKLEEEIEETGTEPTSTPPKTEPVSEGESELPSPLLATESETEGVDTPSELESLFPTYDIQQEDKASDLKAVDELLIRLEQRLKTGSITESEYKRLRSRYLKRKAEISGK